MYVFLDKFFFVFHSFLIVFNLFGWIWKKTRKANLAVLFLTTFSWFGLGLFYGFGYCPCTDWHWQVRMELGHYDMPPSYLTFLIKSLTGFEANKTLVDIFAVIFLFLAFFASLYINIRAYRKKQFKMGSAL
jgi:hypothetical protein